MRALPPKELMRQQFVHTVCYNEPRCRDCVFNNKIACYSEGATTKTYKDAIDRYKAYGRTRVCKANYKQEHKCTCCSAPIPEGDKHKTCPKCRARAKERYHTMKEEKNNE